MNTQRFKEVLTCFLDSSSQFDMDKGEVALEVGGEYVSARIETRRGLLYVREGDEVSLAEDWLIRRVAALPTLADRILSAIPESPNFVTAPGDFLDNILYAPHDETAVVPNSAETVSKFLDRRPGGTCSILYLTSDAGEGKTTLINQLSRYQAERYKRKESDWLLVPIGLGGRPFLRFDDVVVASLVNQLRFQRLYFDAFVELVRMGVLVPALDGFEEIFVENAVGDAISSLGTLIRQLSGEGSLLIAARKAYFEFRRLETQAKLLDGLPNTDVSFGRVALCRWGKQQFVSYAEKSGISFPEAIYDGVVEVLGAEHPLITRPVLVRRVLELYRAHGIHFLSGLRPEANNYFSWLVNQLIEREANEKWINKHGDPPMPLLTVKQHHELLSYIAEEMWISKTASLSRDMMDSLTEIFCESQRFSPIASRQIRERVKQHALIVSASFGREFSFDHEEFREFFLGEQIASYLLLNNEVDIRRIFRSDLVPKLALDSAFHLISQGLAEIDDIINLILRISSTDSSASFVRENGGALIASLLSCSHSAGLTLVGLVLPPDCLENRTLSNLTFRACYFRAGSIERTLISACTFEDCEFEYLTIGNKGLIDASFIRNCRIHTLAISDSFGSHEIYDPEKILNGLARIGFDIGREISQDEIASDSEIELDLRIAEKALQTFQRSTFVFADTFRLRLSINASRFRNDLLPRLIKAGLIEQVQVAPLEKFRLSVPFSDVVNALSKANGSFDGFMKAVQARP